MEQKQENKICIAVQMFNFMAGGDWKNVSSMEDILGLLSSLKEAGYDGVEWLNFMLEAEYMDVSLLRSEMDRIGLKTCGLHFHVMGPDALEQEVLEENCRKAAQRCQMLDSPYLIFAFSTPDMFGISPAIKLPKDNPFDPDKFQYSPEQIDEWVKHSNRVTSAMEKACEGTGIEVLYHNHADEMLCCSDGKYFLDAIVPAKEVDVYWAAKGTDGKVSTALDYVRRQESSIRLLHVKDGLNGSVFSGEMCGWGKGTFPLKDILECARELKLPWVVIENDAPGNFGQSGLADALESMQYAKEHLFA